MGYYKCTCCSCDVAVINCNTQYPRDELCDGCVSREYWAQRAEIAALKDEVERLKDAEISLEADVEHLWDSRNDGWNHARAWKRCAKRWMGAYESGMGMFVSGEFPALSKRDGLRILTKAPPEWRTWPVWADEGEEE